jgi:hypothetical protein
VELLAHLKRAAAGAAGGSDDSLDVATRSVATWQSAAEESRSVPRKGQATNCTAKELAEAIFGAGAQFCRFTSTKAQTLTSTKVQTLTQKTPKSVLY